MKLGILACDHVRPALLPQFGDYIDMFEKPLRRHIPNLELVTYRLCDDEFPAQVTDCDAYISTGSRQSVYSDIDWVKKFSALVTVLAEKEIPFVGICFGHQMMAHALGGKVEKARVGWGVGISSVQIKQSPSWMTIDHTTPSPEYHLIVSHQDQVTVLPENATVLASNDFCPYSMIQIGQSLLGIQGHPEFNKEYSRTLMMIRKDKLGPKTLQNGLESLDLKLDSDLVFAWIGRFLQNCQKE